MKQKANIISIDEFKKQIPGYDPKRAETFHRQSAKMADKAFEKALRTIDHSRVILVSGGSASGKTEFIASQLVDENAIIFDSTLSRETGAQIKIRKSLKARKKVEVVAVIPDDLKRAFTAFLNRERKFDEKHFFKTHCGSRKTLIWIAKNHPQVGMRLVKNSFTKVLKYSQLIYKTAEHISILESLQLSENEIERIVYDRFK